MGDIYLNRLRPLFANEQSFLSGAPGVPPEPVFIVNINGEQLNESRLSQRIVGMGKKLNPSLKGNLRGSRIRKGIITMHRKEGKSSKVNAYSQFT